MVIDYSKFERITLSDDSEDEEIHPNVDERSFRRWRREEREGKRREMEERLQQFRKMEGREGEEGVQEEIQKLEHSLRQRVYDTEKSGTITNPADIKLGLEEFRDIEGDVEEKIFAAITKTSDIAEYVACLRTFSPLQYPTIEDFLLLNMSENIKEGNDEAGLRLCRFSLIVKYLIEFKEEGFAVLGRMVSTEKKALFNEESLNSYRQSKEAILKLGESKE